MAFFKSVDGTSIYYSVKGQGVPIVFIHPPLLTSENFYYQVKELSENYQIITFDIRGHGNSEASDQPITYQLIVQDIFTLLDELKLERVFLCGYSTGGEIVFEGLLSDSNRFLGGILIGTQSEAGNWFLRTEIKTAIALCRKFGQRLLSFGITIGNSDDMETFKRLHKSAIRGDVDHWKQYYECSLYYNCTDKLSTIDAPCLLIFGQKNTSFHRYAKLLQNSLPNAQLHWVDGARHQIPTKHAPEMNRILSQWLTTTIPYE